MSIGIKFGLFDFFFFIIYIFFLLMSHSRRMHDEMNEITINLTDKTWMRYMRITIWYFDCLNRIMISSYNLYGWLLDMAYQGRDQTIWMLVINDWMPDDISVIPIECGIPKIHKSHHTDAIGLHITIANCYTQ